MVSEDQNRYNDNTDSALIIDHDPKPQTKQPEASVANRETAPPKPVDDFLSDHETTQDKTSISPDKPGNIYSRPWRPPFTSRLYISRESKLPLSIPLSDNTDKIPGTFSQRFKLTHILNLFGNVVTGIKPIPALGIFLVIVFGWYFLINGGVDYKSFTVKNDGYKYSFLFYANSSLNTNDQHQQVTGNEANTYSALAFKSPFLEDCHQQFPNSKIIFTAKIQKVSYPVCSEDNLTIVFSNFKYNGIWQETAVYSTNSKSTVNTRVASKTINSISID